MMGDEINSDSTVQRVTREVIEGKLLHALSDEGMVAVLMREQDLNIVIEALEKAPPIKLPESRHLLVDLCKLRDAAFLGEYS